MFELHETRIIVTGGASGIGEACVKAYSDAGARTVSLDTDVARGEAIAADQRAKGKDCQFIRCDVSTRANVDEAFAAAIGRLGGLDVLASIAGVNEPIPAEDITEAEMRRMLDINFMGTFFTNQAAFRAMTGGGRIINVGSIAGIRGVPGFGHYGASKGAIQAWTRIAAQEWGCHGISVNVIAPMAMTPMAEKSFGDLPPEELRERIDALSAVTPPADVCIAPLMLFLASESSSYISGQTLSVDGGRMLLGS
jgi:NAD(P)-dependent dehydrogenase (short-subunit alcohol dehydrogenase family)